MSNCCIKGFGNIRHASVTAQKQDFICLVGEKKLQVPRQLVIEARGNHNYEEYNYKSNQNLSCLRKLSE